MPGRALSWSEGAPAGPGAKKDPALRQLNSEPDAGRGLWVILPPPAHPCRKGQLATVQRGEAGAGSF